MAARLLNRRPMLPYFAKRALPAVLLLLALPSMVAARSGGRKGPATDQQKIDHALLQELAASTSLPQRVIIRTKPGARTAIRKALDAHGDRINSEHVSLSAISAEVHVEDIRMLAARDSVLGISIDALVRADAQPAGDSRGYNMQDPSYDALRDTLGISSTSYTGNGIVVALIDSGIQPSSDFSRRIKAFYDFTRGGIATAAYDDYGHGTHVAGLIGSMGNLSSWYQYKGVAPGVKFVGLKVLDANGSGYTSHVIQAVDFAVANKAALGINIINLSLGHPIYESAAADPLVLAVERATAAGIVVVTSAGNYGQSVSGGSQIGYAGVTSPANAPSVITVGAEKTFDTAVRSDDVVADYSSRGPTWYDGRLKPDLVAPADRIVSNASINSTIYNEYPNLRLTGNNNYIKLSGTSMAAGVASGVVALVMEANRSANRKATNPLGPNAIKAILEYTAIPLHDAKGALYNELTQGAGGINAAGAIDVASNIDVTKPVQQYWMTGWNSGDSFGTTTIGGEVSAWAQLILWDDNIVWGSGLVTYHLAALADNIVWGSDDNTRWGLAELDNIVWGSLFDDNIVWGSFATWADNIVWGSALLGLDLGDNIVWGSFNFDNIVWGSFDLDNIVWGSFTFDNIVLGSLDFDNIVWSSIIPAMEAY